MSASARDAQTHAMDHVTLTPKAARDLPTNSFLRTPLNPVRPHPRPRNMAKLSDLPQELLLDIVERLEGDNPTLASLCLTSRACANLCQNLLYRHVKISEDAKPVQIALLLRTMFDRKL
jgi:hypothetical protein